MGLGRAVRGFFLGFRHGIEIEGRIRESQRARARQESIRALWQFAAIVVGVVLVVTVVVVVYEGMDQSGWISHTRTIHVDTALSSWAVGEYKTCYSSSSGVEIKSILCEGGLGSMERYGHTLDVTLWGAIDRKQSTTWSCQRKEASLICKAMN